MLIDTSPMTSIIPRIASGFCVPIGIGGRMVVGVAGTARIVALSVSVSGWCSRIACVWSGVFSIWVWDWSGVPSFSSTICVNSSTV